MLSKISCMIGLICLVFVLYGVLVTIKYEEPNLCKMTYMFEYSQFTRISFKENDNHPRYALYGYSEGQKTENARNNDWTGAPVVFIPGNAGSFKQVRSLASVALRKGIDNKWGQHLDYFSVDLNSEFSALYGGILDEQTEFVGMAILKVLDLYKNLKNSPKQVTLVGHSMGGKIAQAILLNPGLAPLINTIICLATPMDQPVINLDIHTQKFYHKIKSGWMDKRSVGENRDLSKRWDDKLLITIGGGSRDILVHSGLTSSIFSDVHAQTTTIPNVWLTTDHKCSAWCLELVLVVNRFLYSILQPVKKDLLYGQGHQFIESKKIRLLKAQHYFENAHVDSDEPKEFNMVPENRFGDWEEDSRRVFSESFAYGINKTRNQMIRLMNFPQYKYLNVEAINVDNEEEFVFGCAATDVFEMHRYCSKALSITKNTTKLPSVNGKRFYVRLDLHEIKNQNPEWTHVILRLLPTTKPVRINVDVNEGGDRELKLFMPKWHSFSPSVLLEDSILGGSIYRVNVYGMDSPYQVIEFDLQTRSCSSKEHHAVGKVNIPWEIGQERFHYFTNSMKEPLYIYVPTVKVPGFNATTDPITVELHLDPSCRYKIVTKNSFSMTLARIVQIYFSWWPAHIVVVLLLAFRYQISLTPNDMEFKCNPLHKSLLKCSPFFIISAARLFIKLIMMTKVLPVPEDYDHSLLVSVILHGSSLAILTLAVAAFWTAVVFCGNVTYKILFRLIQLPIPTLNIVVPIIEKLPVTAAVALISIALMSCGGLALICACGVYFILLTKMYEDFLEEFVYNTAKDIAMKLFGRFTPRKKPSVSKESNDLVPMGLEQIAEEFNTENPTEEQKEEQELNRILKQTMDQQKKILEEKKREEEKLREEYDAIIEGLSPINYHLTLFLFLIILTILNLPATITWAKNYDYSKQPMDPASLVAPVLTIFSLAILWQLNTPRTQIKGYKFLSMALYGMALITIIYCLDSVYLLNNLIATIFGLAALQQIVSSKITLIKPSED